MEQELGMLPLVQGEKQKGSLNTRDNISLQLKQYRKAVSEVNQTGKKEEKRKRIDRVHLLADQISDVLMDYGAEQTDSGEDQKSGQTGRILRRVWSKQLEVEQSIKGWVKNPDRIYGVSSQIGTRLALARGDFNDEDLNAVEPITNKIREIDSTIYRYNTAKEIFMLPSLRNMKDRIVVLFKKPGSTQGL